MRLTQGSLRQQQVCDALRCSGLHACYTEAFNEYSPCPGGLGNLFKTLRDGIDYCNYEFSTRNS